MVIPGLIKGWSPQYALVLPSVTGSKRNQRIKHTGKRQLKDQDRI